MRILFLPAVAALLLLVSCNQEPTRKTTPNGYEYILHTSSGGESPEPGDYAYFHAQIRKADSVVYQTRLQSAEPPFLKIPTEDAPSQQPSPIEDVLAMMSLQDSATVFIPLDSLPQAPQGFEDVDQIIYDIVMVDIKSEEEFQQEQARLQEEAQAKEAAASEKVAGIIEQYNAGDLDDQLQTTESGLEYVILEEGTGPAADPGTLVSVDYYGVLADGTQFDNSYKRGQSFTFPLGQGSVIPGWDEGIDLLNEGATAAFFVPAELGYGEAGSPPVIPPNSNLIFYVELKDVQQMQ